MRSKNILEDVDFERDVPTTADDVAALWRAREYNRMDAHEYLDFLLQLTKDLPPSRETSAGRKPFTL